MRQRRARLYEAQHLDPRDPLLLGRAAGPRLPHAALLFTAVVRFVLSVSLDVVQLVALFGVKGGRGARGEAVASVDFFNVKVDVGAAATVLLVEVEFGVAGVSTGCEVGGDEEEGESGCENGKHDWCGY